MSIWVDVDKPVQCVAKLSEQFYWLLYSSPLVNRNSELSQIEYMFEVNLSGFKRMFFKPEGNQPYEMFFLTHQPFEDDNFEFAPTEIWNDIHEFKFQLEKLISGVHQQPKFYLELWEHLEWGSYFKEGRFLSDLEILITYVYCAIRQQAQHIAFVI
jgi:hypothetical protein